MAVSRGDTASARPRRANGQVLSKRHPQLQPHASATNTNTNTISRNWKSLNQYPVQKQEEDTHPLLRIPSSLPYRDPRKVQSCACADRAPITAGPTSHKLHELVVLLFPSRASLLLALAANLQREVTTARDIARTRKIVERQSCGREGTMVSGLPSALEPKQSKVKLLHLLPDSIISYPW